ncbi:hypothetical protein BT63DRAFT_412180 [Microthyrium microscopicum]|uniref:Uncharacterized protein n=1 Tax=Microthyrium microscopicum TaxID=703497 RepID=A0A6A6UH20_9PEZI|nr:hypothetical protein BT63DRAFT_412180 [Microthyrium microscopicum]
MSTFLAPITNIPQNTADWHQWVAANRHMDYNNYTGQKYQEIHQYDARLFYGLTQAELNTLPHKEFRSRFDERPGWAYCHYSVLNLVYRKEAMIAGVHRAQGYDPALLLKHGKILYDDFRQQVAQFPELPQGPRVQTRPWAGNRKSVFGDGAYNTWLETNEIPPSQTVVYDP